MGAMECDRNWCENVMCDRYSLEHGYICDECFDELVSKGPEQNIEDFMSSRKRKNKNKEARARFNIVFPIY